MYFALGFTWLFWIAVSTVLLVQHKSRWGWYVMPLPFVLTAALFGVAEIDADFAVILIIGLHLVMAPRLIWEEILTLKSED